MKAVIARCVPNGCSLELISENELEAIAIAAWMNQAVTLANFAGETMPMRFILSSHEESVVRP